MSKPCRLTFFAYMHGASTPRGYDKDDLINGIDYAEGLLDWGYSIEPHDLFNLTGYIEWAKAEIRGIHR